MAVQVVSSARWRDLADSLSFWLSEEPPGVFETVTVVVASRSVGRMVRQHLAASLPGGICAGVDLVTLPQWVQSLARRHGVADDLEAWRSTRLQLAVAGCLDAMVVDDQHPILAAHLGAKGSPARRMQLAGRLARLLRRYVEWAPEMVAGWLSGDEDTDATGAPLPPRLTWQPELVRRVAEELTVDPVETWQHLGAAVETAATATRTVFFCLTDVAPAQIALIGAHGASHDTTIWQVTGTGLDDWTLPLEAHRTVVGADAPAAPSVEVHGSHGPARQVEVLRDELCRRFAADATLEPRDALVVCPEPEVWWPHLRAAFTPAPEDPLSHPGRQLRIRPGSSSPPNQVVHLIRQLLRLPDDRATATSVADLLLMPPVAHRWRLTNRRDQVTELVAAAGVRWGLDERHRKALDLGGVTQNTWLRGLDRLLTGLALTPASGTLSITGVEAVGTSDLDLVGTLAELVSRLRKFTGQADAPASAATWVTRVRDTLTDLVGPSFDDEWMLLEAHAILTDMAEHLRHTDTLLVRAEFARLFEAASRELPTRPAVGNGELHVVAIGDLQHVPFRLVCLLGVGDPPMSTDADLVELGPGSPDRRGLRQARLLAHARAADDVIVVTQNRDEHTNDAIAEATAVTSLLRDLGGTIRRVDNHPLHSHAEANFIDDDRRSFDQHALLAAEALVSRGEEAAAPHVQRRRAAIALPTPVVSGEVTLDDLHGFLRDPAKSFLQSAAAVRIFTPTQLKDELPLQLDSLESWGVQDRLLRSLRAGLTPSQAAAREVQTEVLPPGLIGRGLLEAPMTNATKLWDAAQRDLDGPMECHRVEMDLDGVRLSDVIPTHAGRVVHVVASKGVKQEVLPWLQILALAATGVPGSAVVHRMDRQGRFDVCARRELLAPPADVATELLLTISRAFQQGRGRLVPLPLDPALVYAGQLISGRPDPRQWELRTRDWDAPWRFLAPQWQLFYSDDAARELRSDPATGREPQSVDPASDRTSAFGAWVSAIYVPLLRGGM